MTLAKLAMKIYNSDDDNDNDDEDGGPPICGMDTHGMCHRCPK